MNSDQNWYRQLLALILLSTSKAAVEFLTNPGSRQNATDQLKGAFQDIDYNALAGALTTAIDNMANESKDKLNEAIDQIRDTGVQAVEEYKGKAEKQLGAKKSGGKMKWFFAVALGGLLAYFLLDEQRRDDLMDNLTGSSGPIQPQVQNAVTKAEQSGQSAVSQAENVAKDAIQGSSGSGNAPQS